MTAGAPTLTGSRVVLRAPEESDVAKRQAAGWHASIERGYGSVRADGPATHEEALAWHRYVTQELSSPTSWVIDVDGELAGVANLHHVSERDRNAMFAVGMLSPRFLGRGLGSDAMRTVLDYAFGELALHRVWLRVLEFNDAAIACYRACGFVEEGRQRESCLVNGRWHDDLFFGLLDREYGSARR